MQAYDSNNIFTKIIAGEIPAHRVYEDEEIISFMDVMPQSKGHTLVVPKAGSRNLLDADPEVLSTLVKKTQKIAKAVKSALGADGIRIVQFNEPAAGQSVFHLHVHIIPVYEGTPLQPHSGDMADNAELAALAEKIKAAL